MSTREVCGECVRVCVLVGDCGVSGSACSCVHFFCVYLCVCDLHKQTDTWHPIIDITKLQKTVLICCISLAVPLFISFMFSLSLANFHDHTSSLQHFHAAKLGEVSFIFPSL